MRDAVVSGEEVMRDLVGFPNEERLVVDGLSHASCNRSDHWRQGVPLRLLDDELPALPAELPANNSWVSCGQ